MNPHYLPSGVQWDIHPQQQHLPPHQQQHQSSSTDMTRTYSSDFLPTQASNSVPVSNNAAQSDGGGTGPTRLQHLTRFLACRNCRRRKLRCDAQRPTCGPCARRKPPSPADLPDDKGRARATQQSQQWEACCYDAEPPGRRKKQPAASRVTAQGSTSRGSVGGDGQRNGSGEEAKLAEMQNKIRELERQLEVLQMKDVKPTIMNNGGYSGDPSPSASPSYPSSQRESPSRFTGYHPNGLGVGHSSGPPSASAAVFGPIPPPPQVAASFESLPVAGPGPGPDLMGMPMSHPGYPSTSTQFQYPQQVSTYRPLHSSGLQEQQQAFVNPTSILPGQENHEQLQTMPAELDLWALNSVHPNAVGFNYFQARDFALGEDADRPKYTNADLNSQLSATGYPTTLPPPEILHMLVRHYFNKGNFKAKMIDQGRFWQRLSLPPNHPDYPYLGTLHAICAAASHLTASTDVKRKPPRPLKQAELSSLLQESEKYDPCDTGSLAFRDYHARIASEIISVSMAHTHPLYSVLEATLILQYHWMHEARIAKAWVYPGITASLSNYLALNERRPPERAARMTAVEMRDADLAYWIGFASDKMACSMSSWPSSYREEDITAFLPTRPGPHGEFMQPSQWLGSSDLYIRHPIEHCDSMIFFIKSTILLSRVHTLIRDSRRAQLLGLGVSAQAYHAQRNDIDSFYMSIPRYWKTLFKEDGVDFDMLLCLLGTFLATIHMSELIPFVEPALPSGYDSGSATAAMNILALAESLIGTSLDLRVLPMFVPCVMFHASRVLVGELQRAIARRDHEAAQMYNSGLSSLCLAMDIFGEEYSQMFSLVDGVREQALADSRMTAFAKSYEKVVTGKAKGGAVMERPEVAPGMPDNNTLLLS